MYRHAFLPTLVATLLLIVTGCSDQLTGPNSSSEVLTKASPSSRAGGGLSGTPNSIFALDFSTAADAGDVGPNSAGWQVDRRDVDTWEQATFDGDGRLHINIDESGPVTGFRDYQGKKYLPMEGGHWNAGHKTVLSYRFYIDPAWENDPDGDEDGQQTGMWGVVTDADENIIAYPILEYQDSDAVKSALEEENESVNPEPDGAQFRMWLQTGKWKNLGLPQRIQVDPEEGGWVHVKAKFLFNGDDPKVKWYVNGALLATDETIDEYGNPALFREPILNSQNFGKDVDYYYDDITVSTPGHARISKGQAANQGQNPN